MDDSCENVAEVLVHAWLKLLGLPAKVCHLAELLLAKPGCSAVPRRMQQEIASMAPIQIVEVGCLSASAVPDKTWGITVKDQGFVSLSDEESLRDRTVTLSCVVVAPVQSLSCVTLS